MSQARNGDMVKVNYTGKLENGEVFDSSINRNPLEFVIGDGSVIPAFEKGVVESLKGIEKISVSSSCYNPCLPGASGPGLPPNFPLVFSNKRP